MTLSPIQHLVSVKYLFFNLLFLYLNLNIQNLQSNHIIYLKQNKCIFD